MIQETREEILRMLEQGFAQKTIARKYQVTVKDVHNLGRAFNVGRRPGDTRRALVARQNAPKSFEARVARMFR